MKADFVVMMPPGKTCVVFLVKQKVIVNQKIAKRRI